MKFNSYLRDMNLGVAGADQKHIEVFCTGFALFQRRSVGSRHHFAKCSWCSGEPQPAVAGVDGAVLVQLASTKT